MTNLNLDNEFWYDFNIKKDLIKERKKQNVFIYIYRYINNIIDKISPHKDKMENFF